MRPIVFKAEAASISVRDTENHELVIPKTEFGIKCLHRFARYGSPADAISKPFTSQPVNLAGRQSEGNIPPSVSRIDTERVAVKYPFPCFKQLIKRPAAGDSAKRQIAGVVALPEYFVSQRVADRFARNFRFGDQGHGIASHQIRAQAEMEPGLFQIVVPGRLPEGVIGEIGHSLDQSACCVESQCVGCNVFEDHIVRIDRRGSVVHGRVEG